MFFSILDINNLEYLYQSFIQILIQNPLNHPLTLVKRKIGYEQQDVSLNDYQTTKQEREYKSQQKEFTIPFDFSKFTETDKEFLTMFIFEHKKFTQTQFEKLALLLTQFK